MGSTLSGFPSGACGVAADIVGRLVWETLQWEGKYVCGCHHPQLESEVSHAWFEVGEFIINITYDQFHGSGLTGWVAGYSSKALDGMHNSHHRRDAMGFAHLPSGLLIPMTDTKRPWKKQKGQA